MSMGAQKFLFVGNHPCLDFVNTQMIVKGEQTDVLESFDDLVCWLVQAKLLTELQADVARAELDRNETASLLEQAKNFRAILRGLAERIAVHKSVPAAAIDTINQFLSQRPGYSQLVRRKGRFSQQFHSVATSAQDVLAPLAESASDMLCRIDLAMIKKCGNPACILYFFDTTKNHTRNWCSMQGCGNRMKVAAHYKRSVRRRSESEHG